MFYVTLCILHIESNMKQDFSYKKRQKQKKTLYSVVLYFLRTKIIFK